MKLTEMIAATEVKLVLACKRTLRGRSLCGDLRSLFGFGDEAKPMNVWYMDTPTQTLRRAGWSVRYRHKSGSSLELTYKKRYTESGYRAMLLTKTAQDFAKDFTPELDAGYSKTTCSLSSVRVFNNTDIKLDSLEARRLSILSCPRVLTDWNGKNKGFAQLCEAMLIGPVAADTYTGEFEGLKIKLEIWPLPGYFCELSFDIPSENSAGSKARILHVLEENNLVLKVNTLKTDAMLDHYVKRMLKQSSP